VLTNEPPYFINDFVTTATSIIHPNPLMTKVN